VQFQALDERAFLLAGLGRPLGRQSMRLAELAVLTQHSQGQFLQTGPAGFVLGRGNLGQAERQRDDRRVPEAQASQQQPFGENRVKRGGIDPHQAERVEFEQRDNRRIERGDRREPQPLTDGVDRRQHLGLKRVGGQHPHRGPEGHGQLGLPDRLERRCPAQQAIPATEPSLEREGIATILVRLVIG
jgi:hypothetical protein